MRILHIVAGLPPHGGGLSAVVPALCGALAGAGAGIDLATLGGPLAGSVAAAAATGVRLHVFQPSCAHAVGYSADLRRHLEPLVRGADLVHIHSNWTFPVWWGCHVAARCGKPVIWTPHGCLEPVRLRHGAWKKRLAGLCCDNRYLRRAACLHATSTAELDGLRAYGLRNPVAVIPVGADFAALDARPGDPGPALLGEACRGKRILLFMSRVHPLKGLDWLVAAWAQVADRFTEWQLVIVGPDERGYAEVIRRDAQRRGLAERITFCGPLQGAARRAALAAAELFVLPSRTENLGIVVAEAAYLGKPVITTQATPWSELAQRGGGWWIPTGSAALAATLAEALALGPAELRAKGADTQAWVAQTFAWPPLARQVLAVYGWILGRSSRPASLHVTSENA